MSSSFSSWNRSRLDLLLGFEPLVLNLEEEVALAEDVLILPAPRPWPASYLPAIRFFAELARQAAGEADQPLGVLGQIALADARLAIEAMQRASL